MLLSEVGTFLSAGLLDCASRQQAQLRRISEACDALRDALARDDRNAASTAAQALCDAEYAAHGECEIFGPLVDQMVDSGMIAELDAKP